MGKNATLPASRRLGDGYEPHVDDIDGRLIYAIPVDSGFVSVVFDFEISRADLDVLLADPYRRIALQWVLHTILQRSMSRGRRKVMQADFRAIVTQVLFSPAEELARLIATVDVEHNIRLEIYIEKDLQRLAEADRGP